MFEISHMRKEYLPDKEAESLHENPSEQFRVWFEEALKAGIEEPNAMVLSTVGKNLRPSSRIVLLKQFDGLGFTFFTNYESRKGKELELNPFASLLFPWISMQRQVRIEGQIMKIPKTESEEYFGQRPEGSKISAWISPQSNEVPSREYLEKLAEEFRTNYIDKTIPRPFYWGGYRLVPDRFEFWQGRENRLHDRYEYYLNDGEWKVRRLAP